MLPNAPEWMDQARCAGLDHNLFFCSPGDERKLARAKLVCGGCPVAPECLDFALTNRINHGVWGGKSEAERDRLRRKMRRAARAS